MDFHFRGRPVTRRLALGVAMTAVILVACGCGAKRYRSVTRASATKQTIVPGGCGQTQLRHGLPPQWAMSAFDDSSSAVGTFAMGAHHRVLAYFGRLRAGHPTDPANKVLWIVRPPRGSHLVIRAHPLGRAHPRVTVRRVADSGPGPIYPSYVNVPRAGCWHATLHWAHSTDSVDLKYVP